MATVPTSVWVITALWAVLLLGASLIWPVSYGYDEATHVDMAYAYSVHPLHFYGPGQLYYSVGDVNMQRLLPGIPPRQRLAVAPIKPRSQRPTLAQLGGPTRETGGSPDQMVQHPPLYYWMEAVVMRIPGVSSLSYDVEIWLMRLGSIALMLPLPLLCWYTTRRLLMGFEGAGRAGSRHRRVPDRDPGQVAVLAAVLPLSLANLVRDGASVDNDVLLILTTSVLTAMLARVVTGDLSKRTALWVAAALAGALWSKGFGLVLPVPVFLAYLYAWWRTQEPRRDLRTLAQPLAIAAAGGLVGSFWWVRNLVDYGTVQTDGYGSAFQQKLFGTPSYKGTLGHFISPFLRGYFDRVWGGIGLADVPSLGSVVEYGWLILVAIGLVVALFLRGRPGSRIQGWILLTIPILTTVVVAQGSYGTFHKWPSLVRANQGRYLYSTIVVLAVLAAIGLGQVIPSRIYAWIIPAVLSLAVVTNAAAWILILRSWYQPLTPASRVRGFLNAVHGLLRWSPLPYGVTLLLVFILPALASIAAVVVLGRDAIGAKSEAPDPTMPRQLAEATN